MYVFSNGLSFDLSIIDCIDFKSKDTLIESDYAHFPIIQNEKNHDTYNEVFKAISVLVNDGILIEDQKPELALIYDNNNSDKYCIGAFVDYISDCFDENGKDFIFAEDSCCTNDEHEWLDNNLLV